MGSIISSHLSETFKKNQEQMREMNMKNMEKQMALQVARSRDIFQWFSAFYSVTALGLITGFKKTRKPALLAPLVPLTFATAFYWDLAYGNKIHRIRSEAENILANEKDLLQTPQQK